MKLYLDTSALVKLVSAEPESAALRDYLEIHSTDIRFTAALTRTELIRAASRLNSTAAVAHARRLLARLDLVSLTNRLLDAAGVLPPTELRTLDAIHLAAAQTAPDLRAVVSYDARMVEAATQSGLTVARPG
jgi:predicted nucleic acid-binding protein